MSEPSPPPAGNDPALAARSATKATVEHVLVRACTNCGGGRQTGLACASCGNPEPPVTHDLGVQSYYHRNPLRRAAWWLIGQRLAARRVRRISPRG